MRKNPDRARVPAARAAVAALVLTGVLAAVSPASGQASVTPKRETAAADLRQFLPPLPAVPWLDAALRAPRKSASPLPEAGSVSARLLTPEPASSWGAGSTQAAAAGLGLARM
jgi:hypothetical protein